MQKDGQFDWERTRHTRQPETPKILKFSSRCIVFHSIIFLFFFRRLKKLFFSAWRLRMPSGNNSTRIYNPFMVLIGFSFTVAWFSISNDSSPAATHTDTHTPTSFCTSINRWWWWWWWLADFGCNFRFSFALLLIICRCRKFIGNWNLRQIEQLFDILYSSTHTHSILGKYPSRTGGSAGHAESSGKVINDEQTKKTKNNSSNVYDVRHGAISCHESIKSQSNAIVLFISSAYRHLFHLWKWSLVDIAINH